MQIAVELADKASGFDRERIPIDGHIEPRQTLLKLWT